MKKIFKKLLVDLMRVLYVFDKKLSNEVLFFRINTVQTNKNKKKVLIQETSTIVKF